MNYELRLEEGAIRRIFRRPESLEILGDRKTRTSESSLSFECPVNRRIG